MLCSCLIEQTRRGEEEKGQLDELSRSTLGRYRRLRDGRMRGRRKTSTNLSDSSGVDDGIQTGSDERSVVEDEVGLSEREGEESEDESVRGEEHVEL